MSLTKTFQRGEWIGWFEMELDDQLQPMLDDQVAVTLTATRVVPSLPVLTLTGAGGGIAVSETTGKKVARAYFEAAQTGQNGTYLASMKVDRATGIGFPQIDELTFKIA